MHQKKGTLDLLVVQTNGNVARLLSSLDGGDAQLIWDMFSFH
jgi:hypothetical protein